MPTVPTYNGNVPSVAMGQGPQPGIRMPDAPGAEIAARQGQAMGAAFMRLGSALGDIALKEQDKFNRLRATEALYKLKERAMKREFDPDSGFRSAKGEAALPRPDGRSLAQEYGEMLDEDIKEIGAGLSNDWQRQAFSEDAREIKGRFDTDLMRHEYAESRNWAVDSIKGRFMLDAEAMEKYAADPEEVERAASRIFESASDLAGLTGEPNEAKRLAKEAIAGAHGRNISAMVDGGDLPRAQAYLDRFGGQMDGSLAVKARNALEKAKSEALGLAAAEALLRGDAATASAGMDDFERAVEITAKSESGNLDFNEDGTPVTSPVGAKYRMQVMPETARDPGYGIEPARDGSPEENNRVGREKLSAMAGLFRGDMAKAWAAYNAGEKWVIEAEARAEKAPPGTREADWFWQFNNDKRSPENRKQTQDYVTKNMAAWNAGGGQARRMTVQEGVAALRAAFAGNPVALKKAEEAFRKERKDSEDAVKQRDEEGEAAAIRMAVETGRQFSELPQSVREAVPEKRWSEVSNGIKNLLNDDVVTDTSVYIDMISNPHKLRKLTDAQMVALETKLSKEDFKYVAKERAKFLKDTDGSEARGIISFNERIEQSARDIGLIKNTSKMDDGDAAKFRDYKFKVNMLYRDAVEKNGGKKLGEEQEDALLKKITGNVVMKSVWGPDEETSEFLIEEGDEAEYYVPVSGGREVNISVIPAWFRLEARATNPSVTIGQIAEAWAKRNTDAANKNNSLDYFNKWREAFGKKRLEY